MLETKHVRKLLSSTAERGTLIADSEEICGLTLSEQIPTYDTIQATCKKGRGIIRLKVEPYCTFKDGKLFADRGKPNLGFMPEILRKAGWKEKERGVLVGGVQLIIEHVRMLGHGCTLVLSTTDQELERLPGQILHDPIQILQNEKVIAQMAAIDGATWIDRTQQVRSFACLLDGTAHPILEERSRGARFNSAVRYAMKEKNVLIIVASEDGPVSVFHGESSNGGTESPLVNKPIKFLRIWDRDVRPDFLTDWSRYPSRATENDSFIE